MIVTGSASILSRIIDMGFDGALLDRVDAYGDWERQRSSARREMVALVEKVADVARPRHPGFLLIPQNAEHIIENERYLNVIDALNKESLLTGLNGKDVPIVRLTSTGACHGFRSLKTLGSACWQPSIFRIPPCGSGRRSS